MDVDMTSENEGTWVTSGAAVQAATGVGGQAGSSGGRSRPSDGGGADMSCAGDAGPSGSGVPSQYVRGERYNRHNYRESRRKRKNKCSTGEVNAKKIKTGVAEGPDKKEVEAWRSDKSMTFYHSLYKKHKKRRVNNDKVPENTPGPSKRALKRKGERKEVPFTEAVMMPESEHHDDFSSFMKNEKPATMPPRFVNEGDDGSSIAELLHGMSVQGLDEDNNGAAGSGRSKFDHRRVVWWTTSNWHEERKGAAEHENGNVEMASCSSSGRDAQNREHGLSSQGTTYDSVPAAQILDQPREPVTFDREDAAAAGARLLRKKRQRRLAVSDSDIDVEQAQEEFEEFLLFRGEKESVASSDTSDS